MEKYNEFRVVGGGGLSNKCEKREKKKFNISIFITYNNEVMDLFGSIYRQQCKLL